MIAIAGTGGCLTLAVLPWLHKSDLEKGKTEIPPPWFVRT